MVSCASPPAWWRACPPPQSIDYCAVYGVLSAININVEPSEVITSLDDYLSSNCLWGERTKAGTPFEFNVNDQRRM